MSERPVDNYEILEKKLDPTAQEQLSALKDNIRSYIQMGQFAEQAESAINEGEKGVNVEPGKLIAAVDAGEISEELIVRNLINQTNEKHTTGGKIRKWVKNKAVDQFTKQENSHEKIIGQLTAPIQAKFAKEFADLKNAITAVPAKENQPGSNSSAEKQTEVFTGNEEGFSEKSHYTDEERKQIDEVITTAKKYEGMSYKFGATGQNNAIDCSALWSSVFKQEYKDEGVGFSRLTAAIFDAASVDLEMKYVERGDRMFWEDPNGVKGNKNEKGEKIYHIEMTLGKPFEKDGKWYVKTYGSSSDKNVLDSKGNNLHKDGAGYRLREIKDKHHFGKPPYYQKLVALSKNNTESKAA